ncbi:hypothetical protein [Helicobacter cappadocius]|uniref:Uncharacterized protein n=1 Tax=Helicobacter cappadocius TaxID=3063998 RepID=A0AA90PU82_9HELI|nr:MULTISPECIES: hypothetical protein [unclassified Helicobacter]MDO7253064.1 hypothetical protein [Helicobacter sp. faydin-H75]MDP2538810.1 hypothetical protein [Helicobacter sp. faydin-H76]
MEIIYWLLDYKNVLTYTDFIIGISGFFFAFFCFCIFFGMLSVLKKRTFSVPYFLFFLCLVCFPFCLNEDEVVVFFLKKHFLEKQYIDFKVYQAEKRKTEEQEAKKKRAEEQESAERKKELQAKIQAALKEKGLEK